MEHLLGLMPRYNANWDSPKLPDSYVVTLSPGYATTSHNCKRTPPPRVSKHKLSEPGWADPLHETLAGNSTPSLSLPHEKKGQDYPETELEAELGLLEP